MFTFFMSIKIPNQNQMFVNYLLHFICDAPLLLLRSVTPNYN